MWLSLYCVEFMKWHNLVFHKALIRHVGKAAKLIMTSSNGNIFRVTGHLCGEFTGPRDKKRTTFIHLRHINIWFWHKLIKYFFHRPHILDACHEVYYVSHPVNELIWCVCCCKLQRVKLLCWWNMENIRKHQPAIQSLCYLRGYTKFRG